ncbi:hypothetical protein OL263_001690, partial [Campylobacter jejuni]|nr:hypothetical protein [Campylobacter jejuni]
MEELTKEQRQIIEEEIKKEIKKADTFLKPESINKIIQDIIGNIKGNFKYPKNLEEILSSIPQKVYVSLGKEEIKQILKLDFCCFVDNVFYIDFAPKIEPYKHNQNKTAMEEQRIIQCSYDDLLYLFKTYPLIFNHCIFDYKIDKKTPIEQIKKLSFLNCNFKKEIYLHFQECLDIFQMDNCVFEDRVTIKGKFNDNVYFNNSIFKNYANFHTCEFEKTASFYGVRFEKVPNFSACYFKEPKAVNLTNVNIDKLDFKSLEQYIKDNYKDESCKNETKEMQDKKETFKIQNEHQLRYAKNLKDSFRVIKDVLITQNNKLEAQEWHKLELYAKEKELLFEVESCYKEKNKPFIATKSEDKNSINLTFSVLLLWIYRVTSLHHTNLPRIINFASLNIVAFGGLVCLITYLSYRIDKQNILWFFGVLILSVLVMAIVYLTLKKHKLKSIKLILFTFLAFLMALFLIQSIILLHSFSDVVFALFLYCLLVIALICLYPYINLKSFISYCFHWLVYFFLVMVVVIKPQLINPFAGIFSSDKLYESQFEKSLNDLNVSAIINLAKISFKEFNLNQEYKNISFTELNSAKALIVANK